MYGACIAYNITNLFNMAILQLWILTSSEFEKARVGLDMRAFDEWGEYLRIGLNGAFLECLGWWNLNICFLFSAYLETDSTAA